MTTTAISHGTSSLRLDDELVAARVAQITADLPTRAALTLPLERELELLQELTAFDFGRFLLLNGGLSGYWTSYVFTHDGTDAGSDLERWLLQHSTLAGIRSRFQRLSALVTARLRPGLRVASVPCGIMDDVLLQPVELLNGVSIVGADIDPESLRLAEESAGRRAVADRVEFVQADAWQLNLAAPVDLLLSNGLNLYEPNRDRLVSLYRRFRDNLVPGGELLISYIPPLPPMPGDEGVGDLVWGRLGMGIEDVRLDRAIFGDLMTATYLNITPTDELAAQLRDAGLSLRSVDFLDHGVLPIATAVRIE